MPDLQYILLVHSAIAASSCAVLNMITGSILNTGKSTVQSSSDHSGDKYIFTVSCAKQALSNIFADTS